jgi:hypothetical protein
MFGIIVSAVVTYFYRDTYFDVKFPKARVLTGLLLGFFVELFLGKSMYHSLPVTAFILPAFVFSFCGVGICFLVENLINKR